MNIKLPRTLEELKNNRNWVCHEGKIPKDPHTGRNAKSNDPSTWGTYDEAVAAMEKYGFDGIGYEFGVSEAGTERISGIDLDHVIREDGTLDEYAEAIMTYMDTYTELSPSGKGLHILCKTSLQDIGRKRPMPKKCGLEMYNNRHYFTVTGNVYGEPKRIEERTEQYVITYSIYFAENGVEETPEEKAIQGDIEALKRKHYQEQDDKALWSRMFRSSNGEIAKKLFDGDISAWRTHSEADLALVAYLAYWTNGDAERIDRMFRQSGLMREKWEREDYRTRTIQVVLNSNTYEPQSTRTVQEKPEVHGKTSKAKKAPSSGPKNVNGNENIQEKQKSQIGASMSIYEHKNIGASPTAREGIKKYLDGKFNEEGSSFTRATGRKTGFKNLDKITKLHPGLYVLGAISSLGKTTFACQLADQLAESGEHVLYFSLEQSKFELVTKGLARLTAKENIKKAVTAMEIREGDRSPEVIRAIGAYKRIGEYEIIYECSFDTTLENIVDEVNQYIKDNNVNPIVIIDYLQIIRPKDNKQNTKDAVDTHVRALKKLQVANNLVLLVISSLNRANYLTPIDFESFKESGGIEYTADVIWGLQLNVMNDEIFDKEAKLKSKREKVREAKKANPREIELVCLKNRYGISSYSCYFQYYAKYDYFIEGKLTKGMNDISI